MAGTLRRDSGPVASRGTPGGGSGGKDTPTRGGGRPRAGGAGAPPDAAAGQAGERFCVRNSAALAVGGGEVLELQKGVLVALQTGRRKDAGTLRPEQISFGKLNNVREAIAICRSARTILGGNGVTLEHSPLRHADNLESVRTYEGTDEVHTLIMGRAITGIAAFGGA